MNTILWRFILYPGHEFCQLTKEGSEWHLDGISIFTHDNVPCRLSYSITCDTGWNTQFARVEGWRSDTRVDFQIRKSHDHRWWMNEAEVPGAAGCTDLDLNFSPATNTIPLRRLNLMVGEAAEVRAAWLRFPGFSLEPLPQRYQRLDGETFRYESGGGSFVADLRVNRSGLVTNYPNVWQAESISE